VLSEIQATGKTLVINSHLLYELDLICNRVAVLDKGKILAVDKIEKLRAKNAGIEFQLLNIKEAQFEKLKEQFPTAELSLIREARFATLYLKSTEQKNVDALVDALRASAVSIQKINQEKISLEKAFLDILEKGEGE
jgi:ABC-2 type transport system ATP-binding protein